MFRLFIFIIFLLEYVFFMCKCTPFFKEGHALTAVQGIGFLWILWSWAYLLMCCLLLWCGHSYAPPSVLSLPIPSGFLRSLLTSLPWPDSESGDMGKLVECCRDRKGWLLMIVKERGLLLYNSINADIFYDHISISENSNKKSSSYLEKTQRYRWWNYKIDFEHSRK